MNTNQTECDPAYSKIEFKAKMERKNQAVNTKTTSSAGRPFVFKMANGAILHPECREDWQRAKPSGSRYVAIGSAIHADDSGELPPTAMFKEGRFTICSHCLKSIYEHLST